jgi:hypothetical protein
MGYEENTIVKFAGSNCENPRNSVKNSLCSGKFENGILEILEFQQLYSDTADHSGHGV